MQAISVIEFGVIRHVEHKSKEEESPRWFCRGYRKAQAKESRTKKEAAARTDKRAAS
jgi:hypothetical protein